jgi:hypothetical protein
MGKACIARGHRRPVAGSQLDEKVDSTRVTEAISDWQSAISDWQSAAASVASRA